MLFSVSLGFSFTANDLKLCWWLARLSLLICLFLSLSLFLVCEGVVIWCNTVRLNPPSHFYIPSLNAFLFLFNPLSQSPVSCCCSVHIPLFLLLWLPPFLSSPPSPRSSDCLLVGMQAWTPCCVFLPVSTLSLSLSLTPSITSCTCLYFNQVTAKKKRAEDRTRMENGQRDGSRRKGEMCFFKGSIKTE